MDKAVRDTLKHDKFIEEVGHTVDYLSGHKAAVRKYGAVALAVLVVAGAIWAYTNWQRTARQDELRKAVALTDAYVGENAPDGRQVFKTQAEKENAAINAFITVAQKYSSSEEGNIARMHAGQLYCDQGKTAECEKQLQEVAKSGDADLSSLARLSLATLYTSQGKTADAEKLLRELVAKPTAVVSKEQAQLSLARAIMRTKNQEARLICEALQAMDRPAVTRAAVACLGEMLNR